MPRRFVFRLETLLRVRELREREAQRKLAARRAELARLDRLNDETARAILRQQAELRAAQGGLLDPLRLQRGRAWIAHLRRTMTLRQAQRAELVARIDELAAAWREARKQKRMIAELRARRWSEYVLLRDREEQAASDELAQQLP
ncbi:MAG: hypothetical protein AB1716_12280, partial [Planctomycetota bacterium]